MAPVDRVKVEGLDDLRKALRKIGDDDLKNSLKAAHKSSAEIVAADARSRAPVKSGRLKASIRALGSQREGRVSGGKKTVPYYGFIDFGGAVGRNKSIKRPFLKSGRLLYPALANNKTKITGYYSEEIDKIFKSNGFTDTEQSN